MQMVLFRQLFSMTSTISYKLVTEPGNFRAFKILIAAEYTGTTVEVVDAPSDATGKLPALEVTTPSGTVTLTESNAIARYIARLRADAGLTGSSLLASAEVDMWMDFSSHDIELPASLWFYPVLGYLPYNQVVATQSKTDLSAALKVLNDHLQFRTYLVGESITLADIAVASTLVYPFKFVADPSYRSAFPNVIRWFTTLVNQSAFESVVGTVVLAEKELTVTGVAPAPAAEGNKKGGDKPKDVGVKKEKAPKVKEEAKPKEEKKSKEKEAKKAKKEDDDDEPEPDFVEEKKAEHPFKILDKTTPSPFVMDTWKKTYSNCSDYKAAMASFYETFDAAGWSVFRGDYKYNEECKVLFMTSNLIAGFIQRTEEIRKWLFGTLTIRGGEAMKVTSYFLIRGDSIQPLIACNDDAECYTWTKLQFPFSETDKQLLYDYWCSEGPLDGEPCLDSRCYK